jgi:transcriptional regulator with XRE-family HTH domain
MRGSKVSEYSEEENLPKIRGDVLRRARENKGIDAKDLAVVVCLDKRHILQLERGDEHYYFYSLKIKVQAAKRIGKYLELEESDYLYW